MIDVTPALATRLKALQAARNNPGLMLRVAVLGGGCSGFQYEFTLVGAAETDDQIIEKDGVKILIDAVSIEFLDGSTVDYVEELIGASFQIRNPNAKSSCGCGTSFSV